MRSRIVIIFFLLNFMTMCNSYDKDSNRSTVSFIDGYAYGYGLGYGHGAGCGYGCGYLYNYGYACGYGCGIGYGLGYWSGAGYLYGLQW